MPRKRRLVPENERKRCLNSCDRCKSKKRACNRYVNGEKRFDTDIPCQNCITSGSKCTTSETRRSRKSYQVGRKTLKQLKYFKLIIKAMFPECNPDDLSHLKKIADALFVALPNFDSNGSVTEDDSSDGENITGENSEASSNRKEPNFRFNSSMIERVKGGNALQGVADSHLEFGNKENDILISNDHQLGVGGADRLFNAVLKLRDANSLPVVEYVDKNNIPSSRPLIINGYDIHQSLILNLIPPQECELYTNVFFKKLHQSYFIFDEPAFKKRQKLFLENLQNKTSEYDNAGFCNEEICVIYLVWILGRNCYLTKLLQVDSPSEANIVSNSIMNRYIDIVKICLANCFFSNNIHCIRMLYLMSLYCSTEKNRDSSWHILTNTCLKCFGMGFNRNSAILKFDELEQEEIKVVWWSSFKLHMNNCAIMGRLPNVSLYDVDIDLPKLENIEDELFRNTYKKSIELFKIMFSILKNREYLLKSRNPWCKENLSNVTDLNHSLEHWKKGIGYSLEYYKRPKPKRFQIKLHLQYYYCSISLLAPYLIAFALNPKKSFDANDSIINTLCCGINSAVKLMQVISFSVTSGNFNGLLHYDLFYAYNSLMILLLGYTLIKDDSHNLGSNNYNKFKNILFARYRIDLTTILTSIFEIRDINQFQGPYAVGTMSDFSNNIAILLNYFNLSEIPNNFPTDLSMKNELEKKDQPPEEAAEVPRLFDDVRNTKIRETTSRDFIRNYETSRNDDDIQTQNGGLLAHQNGEFGDPMDKGFYDFINFINAEKEESNTLFSDQLLLDWNKLFGTSEFSMDGTCDHQF